MLLMFVIGQSDLDQCNPLISLAGSISTRFLSRLLLFSLSRKTKFVSNDLVVNRSVVMVITPHHIPCMPIVSMEGISGHNKFGGETPKVKSLFQITAHFKCQTG